MLLVFRPKLMQQAMKADADAAIGAFGKIERGKSVPGLVCDDGRAGAGPGGGPGVRSAGGGDYCGDGGVNGAKMMSSLYPWFFPAQQITLRSWERRIFQKVPVDMVIAAFPAGNL